MYSIPNIFLHSLSLSLFVFLFGLFGLFMGIIDWFLENIWGIFGDWICVWQRWFRIASQASRVDSLLTRSVSLKRRPALIGHGVALCFVFLFPLRHESVCLFLAAAVVSIRIERVDDGNSSRFLSGRRSFYEIRRRRLPCNFGILSTGLGSSSLAPPPWLLPLGSSLPASSSRRSHSIINRSIRSESLLPSPYFSLIQIVSGQL